MTPAARSLGAWLLLGAALATPLAAVLWFGCAPPPLPARMTVGADEIRFVQAQVKFTGSGTTPIQLLFLAQEDPGRSDGRILELRLQQPPATPQSGFPGRYSDQNALVLLHQPTPPAGTRPGYGAVSTPITGLDLTVGAAASGVLQLTGTGKASIDGRQVAVTLAIEKR